MGRGAFDLRGGVRQALKFLGLAASAGVGIMALRAQFLYRPGLWEIWWLEAEFLKHLVLGALVAAALWPLRGFRGLAVGLGLAPGFAWLGWPGWLAAGVLAIFLRKAEEAWVFWLAAGSGLYFLAHAKEMAEVLNFLL